MGLFALGLLAIAAHHFRSPGGAKASGRSLGGERRARANAIFLHLDAGGYCFRLAATPRLSKIFRLHMRQAPALSQRDGCVVPSFN